MQHQGEQIRLELADTSLRFDTVAGQWLEPYGALEPLRSQNGYYYSSYQSLWELGLRLPRLRRIRTSDNGNNSRIVLEMESSAGLQPFRSEGELAMDMPLRINLPALLIPRELHQELMGHIAAEVGSVQLRLDAETLVLELDPATEEPLYFSIFSLQNPMRLVIDLEHLGSLNVRTDFERQQERQPTLAASAQPETMSLLSPSSTPVPTPVPMSALSSEAASSVESTRTEIPITSPASQAIVSEPIASEPVASEEAMATVPASSPVLRNSYVAAQQQPQALPRASQAPPPPSHNPFTHLSNVAPAPAPASATDTSNISETVVEFNRRLRAGITYRRFNFATSRGTSGVHLLEIRPGFGQFSVVGRSGVPQTISQLANGAFAAINASYFNTQSFVAIGLLKIDEGIASLPSRGRAIIAFNSKTPPFIGRIQQDRVLWYKNRRIPLQSYNRSSAFFVYDREGESVGSPEQQVIIVENSFISAVGIGPLRVPPQGFAVVYSPFMYDNHAFSLLQQARLGDAMRLDVRYAPNTFEEFRYGVEAGPLLVANGRAAFRPEIESFARGQRILDGRTQQAAIGVRADGTVLLLTADAMIAEELVPLFLHLRAREAMRLDSGSSASLFVNGQVVNRSNERQIVSAITYIPY